MPNRTSLAGSELFIVDNSNDDWKAVRYLRDWCQLSKSIDIATGYFEIGALLALGAEWKQVGSIRILMGDEISRRTKRAFEEGLVRVAGRLDQSIEAERRTTSWKVSLPLSMLFAADRFNAACTVKTNSMQRRISPTPEWTSLAHLP